MGDNGLVQQPFLDLNYIPTIKGEISSDAVHIKEFMDGIGLVEGEHYILSSSHGPRCLELDSFSDDELMFLNIHNNSFGLRGASVGMRNKIAEYFFYNQRLIKSCLKRQQNDN